MHRVKKVKSMNNYLLLLEFDTGELKVYNCYKLLQNPLFSQLKDEMFFATVHIDEMGIVCWNDATDIDPYELYEKSESVNNFAFAS